MTQPALKLWDEVEDSSEGIAEPTSADLNNADNEIDTDELRKKNLAVGLGKEMVRDDIRFLFNLLCKNDVIDPEREQTLTRRMKEGDGDARREVILGNQRLVVSIAKRYRRLGMDFIDLISEGNSGLIHSADRFRPELGNKFCTYATWHIRQCITRALSSNSRTIRIPENVLQKIFKMRKIRDGYRIKHGKKPSDEYLATAMEVSVEEIRDLTEKLRKPESLHQPVGQEGDGTFQLEDTLADKRTDAKPEDNDRQQLREKIIAAVQHVKKIKEWHVNAYLLHAGLMDGIRHDDRDVGKMFDKSPGNVHAARTLVNRVLRGNAVFQSLVEREGR